MAVVALIGIVFAMFSTVLGSLFGVSALVVTHLPFGIDDFFVKGFTMFHLVSVWIPPLGIMFGAFLLLLYFRMLMMVLKLFRIIT